MEGDDDALTNLFNIRCKRPGRKNRMNKKREETKGAR